MAPDYLTQEKKSELEAELLHLKTVVRPAIGERLQTARALGDLSENAEYQTSREDQGKNETRIQHIEYVLKNAKIIKRSGGDQVEFGATVVVRKVGTDQEVSYMIVDEAEADIDQNKITPSSPLGKALCGKRAGDTAVMTTPRGTVEYEIISVS